MYEDPWDVPPFPERSFWILSYASLISFITVSAEAAASGFPAKLTQVLHHRYQAGKKGIVILACELIDNNGKELQKCVNRYIEQWNLDKDFYDYVNKDCVFCGSLVDRIVPGRIRDEKEIVELEKKFSELERLWDKYNVYEKQVEP